MALLGYDIIDAGPCYRCKASVILPVDLYNAAQRSSSISFYCSYGHSQCFREGPTDLDKMRQERDRLAQRVAERDDEVRRQRELREAAERRTAAARGQVTRIKNRVGHGVCPCCNRTFENLHRHMTTKHPTFTAEAAE
jgi:hypothetical protein